MPRLQPRPLHQLFQRPSRPLSALITFAALAALPMAAAGADAVGDPATVRDYDSCMRLVHDRAEAALEAALAWEQSGGGNGARHCAAMALAAIGNFSDAADQLESLAWELPPETADADRAEVLAQAGQFWLDARQPGKADALLSAAIDLAPSDPEIRIDRAMALAVTGRLQDAIVDLSAAVLLDDRPIEALVLRASAYRQSDRPAEAGEDLERVLSLAPDHPAALLERGLLRRQSGDEAAARTDWQTVLRLHADSPAAKSAQRYLGTIPPGRKPGRGR